MSEYAYERIRMCAGTHVGFVVRGWSCYLLSVTYYYGSR